ncbi:MAG: hypothetical protein WA056_02155 [Gallionella sp.]
MTDYNLTKRFRIAMEDSGKPISGLMQERENQNQTHLGKAKGLGGKAKCRPRGIAHPNAQVAQDVFLGVQLQTQYSSMFRFHAQAHR